jgi:hypothetical protein
MHFHNHLNFRRRDGAHQRRTREAARRHNKDDNDTIAALQSDIQTIVNVVYVTASPTFAGPIGGYTTLGPVIGSPGPQSQTDTSPQVTQQPTSSPPQEQQQQSSSSSQQQRQQQPGSQAPSSNHQAQSLSTQQQSSSSTPQVLAAATSSVAVLSTPNGALTAPSSRTDAFNPIPGNTEPSISTATATPEKSTQSSGMSGGAKAGLAFGIILAIALVAGIVSFCYRRQKQQRKYKEMDDEKTFIRTPSPRDSVRGGAAPSMRSVRAPSIANSMKPSSLRSVRTASIAPRLSLRPVTQFLPDITGKRKSSSDGLNDPPPMPGLAMVPPSPTRNLTPPPPGGSPWARGGSPWERRSNHSPSGSLSNPFSDPINPFGETVRSQSPVPAPLNVRAPSPQAATPGTTGPSPSTVAGAAAVGAVAGAAVVGAATATTKKNDPPKPLDFDQSKHRDEAPPATENPIPSPTSDTSGGTGPVSTGTATAVAAGVPGPSNVHRVQLDFKPSMDDELELRAGQLVRLLHEYDDGWVS